MGKGRFGVVVSVSALFAAMAIAACGSGNSNSADEDQITAAITASATSGDPGACTKYQTLRFTEQTSGGSTGAAAVKSCQQDASNSVANKVDVTDISVNGDSATAKVDVTGSVFDGQTLDVALVKQNGQWKLDEFKGFENFDKGAFLAAFPAQLAKEPGSSPQAVACVRQQLASASDQEIESSFVSNNKQFDQQIFGACGKYFHGG
jgi:hypothetical protein